MRKSFNLLFGDQVGDSEDERKSLPWRYQQRRNRVAVLLGLVMLGLATFFVWEAAGDNPRSGITVAFVLLIMFIVYSLREASDAIFNSIFERINLQSSWLHTRLDEIESNTSKDGKLKAQRRWQHYYPDAGSDDRLYVTAPEWWKAVEEEIS